MPHSEHTVIKIRFENATPDVAAEQARELKDELLEDIPNDSMEIVKEDKNTQDFGATLVLLLGAPAVVAVSHGIARYISRYRSTITIEIDGTVRATGISSRDAARIAEVFANKK